MSVDAVLTRELEDVACSYRDVLVAAVPELAEALAWPDRGGLRELKMARNR